MKRVIFALCAALSLGGTLAYADHDKMEKRSHRDSRYVDDYAPRRTTGKAYRTRRGDYQRNGYVYDRYGNVIDTYGDRGGYDRSRYYDPRWDDGRGVPPGLAKKPGGMPPGQYKKYHDRDRGRYDDRY